MEKEIKLLEEISLIKNPDARWYLWWNKGRIHHTVSPELRKNPVISMDDGVLNLVTLLKESQDGSHFEFLTPSEVANILADRKEEFSVYLFKY